MAARAGAGKRAVIAMGRADPEDVGGRRRTDAWSGLRRREV